MAMESVAEMELGMEPAVGMESAVEMETGMEPAVKMEAEQETDPGQKIIQVKRTRLIPVKMMQIKQAVHQPEEHLLLGQPVRQLQMQQKKNLTRRKKQPRRRRRKRQTKRAVQRLKKKSPVSLPR